VKISRNELISLFLMLCLVLSLPLSLKAQQDIYIPYRSNNLWGYADTNANIVILPVYDQVKKQENKMFLVVKDRMQGVVTLNNEIVVPFEEKNIISLNKDYILSQKKISLNRQPVTRKTYYSIQSGEKTFPEEIISMDEIELVNKRYYRVQTKTGKQGLVKTFDNYEGIEKWLIDTSFVKIKSTWSLNYLLIEKDGITTKYSPSFTLSEIDSLEKINFLSEVPEEEIFEDFAEEVKPSWEIYSLSKLAVKDQFQLIVKKTISDRRGKEKISFDTLATKYSKINILTRSDAFNKHDSIDYNVHHKKQLSVAVVTGINKKTGLVNSFGKMTIPLVYDSIANNILFQNCEKVNLICYKNGRCGVVDIQNRILIPFDFDELFMNKERKGRKDGLIQLCYSLPNGIVARKKDKMGIVNQQGEILEFEYDAIKHVRMTSSFQLLKNKKYGILQSERSLYPWNIKQSPVFVEPVFSYPVDGITEISGYLLGIVLDNRRRISGYVDTKGFNYFIN